MIRPLGTDLTTAFAPAANRPRHTHFVRFALAHARAGQQSAKAVVGSSLQVAWPGKRSFEKCTLIPIGWYQYPQYIPFINRVFIQLKFKYLRILVLFITSFMSTLDMLKVSEIVVLN